MPSRLCRVLVLALVWLAAWLPGVAQSNEEPAVPPALKEWRDWVLFDQEGAFCPGLEGRGQEVRCLWPSRLHLEMNPTGGKFSQEWLVLAPGWVGLPGDDRTWPYQVRVNGSVRPVITRQGSPAVHLEPGQYRIDGAFEWTRMPETVHIPPHTGLIDLTLDGRKESDPILDDENRLWLKAEASQKKIEDRLEIRVFRLITDGQPMIVKNRLRLDVSGRSREVALDLVLLPGSLPLSLKSGLPTRLAAGNKIILQVRPGRWVVEIDSRFQGPVNELGPIEAPYGREIWAFASQNHLRLVKLSGLPPIDPGQTEIDKSWQQYPVYLAAKGARLKIKEIRRGDPVPAPDRLTLKRVFWLDFDGQGFTVRDAVTGTLSRSHSLALNPPGVLGRVTVDGQDRLITRQGDKGVRGVELRQGRVNLAAESRYKATLDDLPAVGWDRDVQKLSALLYLPPGWRFLTAEGVDELGRTWFRSWTLLDLFIVLIIALAVYRLWGWSWGLLALFAVALSYHEPDSPRMVWLHILGASALLRVLPQSWFRSLVNWWRIGAIIFLAAVTLPFMIHQVRMGLYPQLDWGATYYRGQTGAGLMLADVAPQAKMEQAAPAPRENRPRSMPAKRYPKTSYGKSAPEPESAIAAQQAALVRDPDALIQTGPGLPQWGRSGIKMTWNGPVDKNQRIKLYLLPPRLNSVLAYLRVVLLGCLILGLLKAKGRTSKPGKGSAAAVTAALLLLSVLIPLPAAAESFPPTELLDQLRDRLTEPPECRGACADLSLLEIDAGAEMVLVRLEIQAAAMTAVPLPGRTGSWLPHSVLLDGRPAEGLFRSDNGGLWALVPEGIHRLNLIGGVPGNGTINLDLPQKPRRSRFRIQGWRVDGLDPHGRPGGSISLTRLEKTEQTAKAEASGSIPAFFRIERVLKLGLTWQAATTVTRISPADSTEVVHVPLLPGETVITEGIEVRDGRAAVVFGSGRTKAHWISNLPRTPVIKLQAPTSVPWVESWVLDASPIWHCQPKGLAPIHHQDGQGLWRPRWEAWPGEEVTIEISRPEAAPGRTVTVDRAELELTPGSRFDKAGLTLNMRSSQGGTHKIILPPGGELRLVKIDGRSQPIEQNDREAVIPLRPGSRKVYLEWRQKGGSGVTYEAPEVNLGVETVNAEVVFKLSRDRWVLFTGGPRLGPAVLFWTYLVVIVLAAVALGRFGRAPLKTHQWFLLGLGLTQIDPMGAILIAVWLMALSWREKAVIKDNWFVYNGLQITLAIMTAAALYCLYWAVQSGLLGIPDMQIAGNGSSRSILRWTMDRTGPVMPRPWAISLPRLAFHVLMLAWALWLALSLIRWLRWGWRCFTQGGMWKKGFPRPKLFKRLTRDKEKKQD